MGTKIVVPNMGESVVEATVARWFVQPGEPVELGQVLVELETEKVNLEVGADQPGILTRIEKKEGDDVHVGEVLGEIGERTSEDQPNVSPTTEDQSQPSSRGDTVSSEKIEVIGPPVGVTDKAQSDDRVTPIARRVAQEMQVDIARVQGSGPGGRVLRQDVENFIKGTHEEDKTKHEGDAPHAAKASVAIEDLSHPRAEERVRLSRRRRTIAQRLVEAQRSAAMLTTFNDVDMLQVMNIRERRKQLFKAKYGVSLGIVSFFVKATILALQDYPRLNAEIQGDEMVLKNYYDIGIAVGAEEGLVVPVLRDADHMTFAQIEQAIQDFVNKTLESTLTLDDLRGGTFTITNGGVFGSLLSTPILNFPQVGILGLHRIEQRPILVQGEIVSRPMMYLALSYDHRIIDGREAVQFLVRIKEVIENPEILFLGV